MTGTDPPTLGPGIFALIDHAGGGAPQPQNFDMTLCVGSGVVNHLRDQLDNCCADLNEHHRSKAAAMFRDTVVCERAFFDAAYKGQLA